MARKMRILHTSDWHLGRCLADKNRADEHDLFLDWLIELVKDRKIDMLIVAGDIFDSGYPPNYAIKQYFGFLKKITGTNCADVVIVGGNHDAPSTLNAPRELLEHFDIHVIGGAEDDPSNEIIRIEKKDGADCIICAVPYLRPGDIKKAIAGETYEQKEKAVVEGIRRRYRNAAKKAEELKNMSGRDLPVIATGHLFASGCIKTDSMRDIHAGGLVQVGSESFPGIFDYVALGHLHHPRLVDKKEHIRYCGSPIPLSFGEAETEKTVIIAEFGASGLESVESEPVKCFRRLKRFTGTVTEIEEQLDSLADEAGSRPWGEIHVKTDRFDPGLHARVMEHASGKPVDILAIKVVHEFEQENHADKPASLDDLTPEEIFIRRCEASGIGGKDMEDMLGAFHELLENIHEDAGV